MTNQGYLGLQLGLAAGICYLAAHALSGEQGLVAYLDLQAQERALSAELDGLEAERARLERRAARMRPESLDRDYLDERARLLLGATAQGEVLFVRPAAADQS